MTKSKNNVITMADVLAKKGLSGNYDKYHSSFFGKDFEIEKIGPEKIVAIMNDTEATEYEKYSQLIYSSCSFFRQKELLKEFDVANPYDVVEAVFNNNYAEVFEFGNLILAKYGFTADKVEKVKKP